MDVLRHLENCSSKFDGDSDLRLALLGVYTQTIDLLPRVAYFGLDIASRLRVWSNSDKLAADGAAHALNLHQPQVAIELLEQGRAVFWLQHLRLRTAFHALLPSELAGGKLAETAIVLERDSHAVPAEEGQTADDAQAKAVQEIETAKRRRLGADFEAKPVYFRGSSASCYLRGFKLSVQPPFRVQSSCCSRMMLRVRLS